MICFTFCLAAPATIAQVSSSDFIRVGGISAHTLNLGSASQQAAVTCLNEQELPYFPIGGFAAEELAYLILTECEEFLDAQDEAFFAWISDQGCPFIEPMMVHLPVIRLTPILHCIYGPAHDWDPSEEQEVALIQFQANLLDQFEIYAKLPEITNLIISDTSAAADFGGRGYASAPHPSLYYVNSELGDPLSHDRLPFANAFVALRYLSFTAYEFENPEIRQTAIEVSSQAYPNLTTQALAGGLDPYATLESR